MDQGSTGEPIFLAERPAEDFSVLRLILIDSLSPGRIIELPLDEGAVLTGRNGRGKTSLLQLLPFFYGESPNRIVVADAGRENFIGYYLPRLTSYIAFEYRRPGGHKRMVIAHADRNGERVLYRFVRHGFDVRQFVQPDGDLVHAPNLAKHLRLQGFEYAERQIETLADYRAVIQGVPSSTTDKQHQRYMRELIQEYACTTARHPLRRIEKIVSGMFRRKTNFEDLQGMVIDCVSDDAASHAIAADRRKIEDWPKDYKAYTTVMGLAPRMAAINQAESRYQAIQNALGEVHAKYTRLIEHTDQEMHAQEGARNRQRNLFDTEKADHGRQRRDLAGQEQSARQDAEFAQKKADELQAQHAAFERERIQDLDARVSKGADLAHDLQGLEERRHALLGTHEAISASYERLKQAENDQFNALREEIQQARQQTATDRDRALQDLEKTHLAEVRQAEQALQVNREPLATAVDAANTAYGRCQQALAHPAVDPHLADLLEAKRVALDDARHTKEANDAQRRALDGEYRKVLQDFQDQERQVAAATRVLDTANADLAVRRSQLSPEPGTLLHFLRSEHPHWSRDIARVIRADLLERCDLSPAMISADGSLYGVSLDLERLKMHPAADTGIAEQEVASAEAHLAAARAALDAARAGLASLGALREKAEKACKAQDLVIQRQDAQIRAAKTEMEEARRQMEAGKRQAREIAAQQLEQADRDLQAARAALARFEDAARIQAQERQVSYQQTRQQRQQQYESETSQLDTKLGSHRQALSVRLAQYDAERDEALRHNGVDTKILQGIEEQISHINQELAAIRRFSDRVQAWHYWRANQWPAHATHLAAASEATSRAQAHAQALAALEANWQQRESYLKAQITQAERTLDKLRQQREHAQQGRESLSGYPAVAVPEYDLSWSLNTLASLASEYRQQAQGIFAEIRKGLNELVTGFRRYPGTPPEQYLQSALETLSPTPGLDWIEPLARWFASEHQGYQRILLMEAGNIAGEVKAFHRTMEEFHRRVQQFNRELQNHLDTSLAFESISRVSVEVISTLTELKYWPAICEMAETHRTWLGGASSDLPPPEFAQNIEQLLDHWEVKSGIRADLKSLIRIQGEVIENGHRRVFRRASDLEAVSSNGLSYLVLATIFVAFINRIRREARVNIIWALDELKDLDAGNVVGLVELLCQNNITLVSAFPDPDPDTLALFRHRFTVEPDRRLATVQLAGMDDEAATLSTLDPEPADV